MLGRGVAGDEAMTSSRETGFASGEFTGRNAAAMATEVGVLSMAMLGTDGGAMNAVSFRRITSRKRVRREGCKGATSMSHTHERAQPVGYSLCAARCCRD